MRADEYTADLRKSEGFVRHCGHGNDRGNCRPCSEWATQDDVMCYPPALECPECGGDMYSAGFRCGDCEEKRMDAAEAMEKAS